MLWRDLASLQSVLKLRRAENTFSLYKGQHFPQRNCSLQGFGDVAVNIFCREAQEAWEELFPFADDRTLKLAAEHGLPDDAAKLAELVDNDKHKFVRLLAALIRSNLRKVPVDDEKGTVDSGPASSCSVVHACSSLPVLSGQFFSQTLLL